MSERMLFIGDDVMYSEMIPVQIGMDEIRLCQVAGDRVSGMEKGYVAM